MLRYPRYRVVRYCRRRGNILAGGGRVLEGARNTRGKTNDWVDDRTDLARYEGQEPNPAQALGLADNNSNPGRA